MCVSRILQPLAGEQGEHRVAVPQFGHPQVIFALRELLANVPISKLT
jgi:hypothetical protein